MCRQTGCRSSCATRQRVFSGKILPWKILFFFFNLQPARHHAKSSLPGWQRCLRHLSHSAVRGGAGRLHQGLPGPHLFLSFSARTSTRSTDGAERQWHCLCKLLGSQRFLFFTRFLLLLSFFFHLFHEKPSIENKLIKLNCR